MKNYILTTPKDSHGQPIQFFKANHDNNVSKAIDQLSGICSGILADGIVTDTEAKFFSDWVRKFAAFEPIWPFTDILARVDRIFADGHCDDEERAELQAMMEAICGHRYESQPDETRSTSLPLDTPLPETLIFAEKQFVITGRFAYGTRRKVFEAIQTRGGFCSDSAPTQKTNYLVIGIFASRDWYNTNYGRKIERAVELREDGTGLCIISEEHWKRFLD